MKRERREKPSLEGAGTVKWRKRGKAANPQVTELVTIMGKQSSILLAMF